MDPSDPLRRFRLDGKVALVTGASSGLGAHFTRTLHAAGATVVATARRAGRLEQVVDGLERATAVPCDLGDAGARERLVEEAVERAGAVDVLVNNAGIGHNVGVEDESLDDFRRVLEVNVVAVWHLSKLVGRRMTAAGSGAIVNVASILGLVGSAPIKQANYTASKAAVVNLTRELALQWARRGVRVNALCPGWFPSEMTAGMQGDESSEAFLRRNSPIPRFGELWELDGALLLLASEAGRFITGTTLVVDGGWTAR